MGTKQYLQLFLGGVACILFRLVPFRPPNIEPLLAAQMPIARRYGAWSGFIFGFANIALYDLITGKFGIWTLITACAYGILGVFAWSFFKKRAGSAKNYALFGIIATIFYDALTGLSIGPIFFHQSFVAAFIGQIPFTLLHLVGNIAFALTLSPVIGYLLTKKNTAPLTAAASITPNHTEFA